MCFEMRLTLFFRSSLVYLFICACVVVVVSVDVNENWRIYVNMRGKFKEKWRGLISSLWY